MRLRWLISPLAVLALLAPSAVAATPIPEGPDAGDLPSFLGRLAVPDPTYAPDPPRHPFMAANGRSNLHDDAFQTDTYQGSGPLGRGTTRSSTFYSADCGSVTFDRLGRIVTVCVGLQGPRLVMLDPRTLDELASMMLPPRQPGAGNPFTDFAGGGYFYLDHLDRAVIPTTTRHVYVVAEKQGSPGFVLQHDFDVTSAVPLGDKIISALPDWHGRIWFASINGVVGTIDPSTKAVKSQKYEKIGNSFAVDETGAVYVVTDGALYRFEAAPDGTPRVVWRAPYENTGVQKPGQSQAGSGTTPTVMGRRYVAITDNADPMNVLVFQRARRPRGARLVCKRPVFKKGASDTDQSLIATRRSMIVENNYGYTGPSSTEMGHSTEPGLERVDLLASGRGCRTVWRNRAERAPTVVPKLSLRNGLVYTYTKDERSDGVDAWYFTALDFRTGRTIFKVLGGEGLGYNNNYAPVTIAPDGAAYVGVLGGLVQLRDGIPPNRVRPRPPRIALRVARTRSRALLARVVGSGTELVRWVDWVIGGRPAASRDSSAPFQRTISERGLWRGRRYRLSAKVLLRDGRRYTLSRTVRVR